MSKKAWIKIPFRCPDCGFHAEAYIQDSRPFNPLLSQIPPETELRCAKHYGKGNPIGCGWTGILPEPE